MQTISWLYISRVETVMAVMAVMAMLAVLVMAVGVGSKKHGDYRRMGRFRGVSGGVGLEMGVRV